MTIQIHTVAVIGAGTMGAAIAAHCANAGLPVLLLDIVPTKLIAEEEAQGLSLSDPVVRNRLVQRGFERVKNARPAALMGSAPQRRILLGNTEDDFDRLADADLIIEAVIEKLEPKQALFERIDTVRKPGSIVATNTSGLPIASLTKGRSAGFKRHFLGAHFFNPPRFLKLLEIIPTADTDPAVTQAIAEFGETTLGKSIVHCKDTPNFIGNRLFSINISFALKYAFENGYSVAEVDALTGPLLGRPSTATFRLLDLVGIDVMAHIARNLFDLIPHDARRHLLRDPAVEPVLAGLLERGRLGNKTGQGFYKREKTADGRRVFKVLNPATFEYELPEKVRFESVGAVRHITNTGERVKTLLQANDRAADFVRALLHAEFAYAADIAPEIAHNLKSVDDDVRWGFNFELGPFQLWDALGVADVAARMAADGLPVADWVNTMLGHGIDSFYRVEDGRVTGFYNWDSGGYCNLPPTPKQLHLADLRRDRRRVAGNAGASLFDAGDGVLLLEFHSKMNTIDLDIIALLAEARHMLAVRDDIVGLVIGNEGDNFCAGANISLVAMAAQQNRLDQIETALHSLQETLLAFKYSAKPVVVAVHNRVLGGGVEILLGSTRVVAHAESYIGLVEAGVGLVPAAAGVTTLVERRLSQIMRRQAADPLPGAQQILETIGLAKVSGSAAEAVEPGYLRPTDRIIMNGNHLLHEAKQEVLALVATGHTSPPPAQLYAGGRDLFAALKQGVWTMQQSGHLSDHDALIGEKLAYIIAGGDGSAPQWVNEQHFLALESAAFLELAVTEKTQARIEHMLETGKSLRN